MVLQSLSLPGSAYAFGALVDAAIRGEASRAAVAAIVLAALTMASLTAAHFAHVFYFELGDLILLRLQSRLIEVSNGSDGIEHHERPDYADKLELLRSELGRMGSNIVGAVLGSIGLSVALLVTGLLLGALDPLLLLIPVAALGPLVGGRHAEAIVARARERAAASLRRARHLFGLCTNAAPAKEVFACDLAAELRRRQAASWDDHASVRRRAEARAAGLRVAGQLVFAAVYVCATWWVLRDAASGVRSVGDVVLAMTLAAQVNHQITAAVAFYQELQRAATTLGDLRWLEDVTARPARPGVGEALPERIATGLTFEGVAFRYPGTSADVLQGVDLALRAGTTVAIVGENGVGKSTLLKLLCGFYQPSAGRVALDGVDLRRFSLDAWRRRISAGFQDFVRFEFSAREAVGVGELTQIDSEPAVLGALQRARAEDLVARLERGLDTRLGHSNPDGTELSGGQWQKLAIGRAMMRHDPLLLVLDEPTAALDAQSEHALFEQYAANARRVGAATGGITILVSHRFSTVRMADQIIVMGERGVREAGSHEELMRRGGLYEELYSLQARAYA